MAKVLIVEDNETLNQVYTFILEKEGHSVKRVFNGMDGLKETRNYLPDVILLDILMPKMDGITFLKKFNASRHPKTAVLILSNLDEDHEVKEAHRLGAWDYILKASVSPSELVAKVNKALNRLTKSS